MTNSVPDPNFSLFLKEPNPKHFAAGETIFEVGKPGEFMYVIQSGSVDIIVGHQVVETADAGHIVGEMALIDHHVRSATAIAKTDCQLVPINQKRFTFLVQQNPYFAVEVMQVLADRLRHMNEVEIAD
jgi:CRP/FNR family cyclic AMP-dependent transcriptional regulator